MIELDASRESNGESSSVSAQGDRTRCVAELFMESNVQLSIEHPNVASGREDDPISVIGELESLRLHFEEACTGVHFLRSSHRRVRAPRWFDSRSLPLVFRLVHPLRPVS